jgi:hypothetical protein
MAQAKAPEGATGDGDDAPSAADRGWVPAFVIVGIAVLANGAALVLHIVRSAPLPAALGAIWAAGLAAIVIVIVRSEPWVRRELLRICLVGIGAGLVATIVYDVSKGLLSNLDPAPWNPYEAVRLFGEALIGTGYPDAVTRGVGLLFHVSNGTTFGLAFALLFGGWATRSAAVALLLGIGWGLFLETFQLVLYPGWMNIKFLDEFRQVSFLGHVAYGATLGLLVRWGLRRTNAEPAA